MFAKHPSFSLCRWPVEQHIGDEETTQTILLEPELKDLQEAKHLAGGYGPDACFVIRPPGKSRGAAIVHDITDAVPFGGAERIRNSNFYYQPMGRFLNWMVSAWPQKDRIEDFADLMSRTGVVS